MIDLIGLDNNKKVNSSFGYRPPSATNGKGSTNHQGIDLTLSTDNIPSVQAGKVVENGWNNARGWYIKVQHSDGYTTLYQHMASKSPLSVGSSVTEGQTIGTQGSTGASTGKHLHFGVIDSSGNYVNPESYLSGAVGKPSGGAVLTDAHGRPVSNAAGTGGADNIGFSDIPMFSGNSLKDILLEIAGYIIKVVAVLIVLIAAAVLFLKAFEIDIRRFIP